MDSAVLQSVKINGGNIIISHAVLNGDAILVTEFTVGIDQFIKVKCSFKKIKGEYPVLMRFGLQMNINSEYSSLNWYGRGPWENYNDRKNAALINTYKANAGELWYPYIRPQETAHFTDVRRASFLNKANKGIEIQQWNAPWNSTAIHLRMMTCMPVKQKQMHGLN